ncbi:hypothetical protein [Spirosoma spitsbergense]|uniref:hypothetical protein n=1 Tax=Spirosoma spitsbergense TaxID=431554 RepID=UPI00036C24EC|nr:hypothetical protein [Spirosoma spitsbergense]
MGKTTVPSTRELQAIKQDLAPTGNLTRCIEAGFLKGAINGQQANALKDMLANMVDYCQEQQSVIFKLQGQIFASQQSVIFQPTK